MTRTRPALTRADLQDAAKRGLTAPQLAAEVGVTPHFVWGAARAQGIRLVPSRAPRSAPKEYIKPLPVVGQCCDCPQLLAPPAPVRCSSCQARRSLAMLAMADDRLIRFGGCGRLLS